MKVYLRISETDKLVEDVLIHVAGEGLPSKGDTVVLDSKYYTVVGNKLWDLSATGYGVYIPVR